MADIAELPEEYRKKPRQPNRPYPKLRKLYRRMMVDARLDLASAVYYCESNHIAEFDPQREFTRLQRQKAELDLAIQLMRLAIHDPQMAETHAKDVWEARHG